MRTLGDLDPAGKRMFVRVDSKRTALIDERAHFFRSGSSSFAKNTEADLKISSPGRSS